GRDAIPPLCGAFPDRVEEVSVFWEAGAEKLDIHRFSPFRAEFLFRLEEFPEKLRAEGLLGRCEVLLQRCLLARLPCRLETDADLVNVFQHVERRRGIAGHAYWIRVHRIFPARGDDVLTC